MIKAFDLTQSQSSLWAGQQLSPDEPLYNMAFTFTIKGAIKIESFQTAFQKLVNNVDALRTTFFMQEGVPKQRILPTLDYVVEVQDWSADPNNEIKTWAENRSQKQFDLTECCFDSVLIKKEDNCFIWYFNQHHLITDAWSVSVLYQTFVDYYLYQEGKLEEIVKVYPFQNYLDFEKTAGKQKNYWKNQSTKQPKLPKLYGRKNSESTTKALRYCLELGQERSQRLNEFIAQREVRSFTKDLSLFNVFATVLFAYLYRISGQRHLSFGIPAHNRSSPKYKKTAGLFIEIFPLTVELDEKERFGDLLKKVKIETNNFLRYAQPRSGNPELSRSFNVLLNYINVQFPDFGGFPKQTEWIHPRSSDPGHHLRIQVTDFDNTGNLQIYFELNEAVFDPFLQEIVPNHFFQLMDTMMIDLEQPIDNSNIITPAEQLTLKALNHSHELFEMVDVIQLFEQKVNETPTAVAVLFQQKKISYQELNEKANQLANHLKQQDISVGKRVALFLKRSPELLISILGVLKAGATYVPIAADYPKERIHYMLKDSRAAMVITQESVLDLLPDDKPITLVLDKEILSIENQSINFVTTKIDSDQLAYIMYTSGSTGKPKGVMITHKSLGYYIQQAKKQYAITEDTTMPLFTSVGFDLTVTSLFTPLIAGGKIVVYEKSGTGPDLSIFDVLEENVVDTVKLTPSHLGLLEAKDLKDSNIRTLVVGGENFSTALARQIMEYLGSEIEIFNEYGPTEATVGCIVHKFNPNSTTHSVPIGKPFPKTEAFILNDSKQPVPIGAPGELHISGLGLAKGYWNATEQTEKASYPIYFNLTL